MKWGSVMMGQVAGLIEKEQSVKEILEEIFNEVPKVVDNLIEKIKN